MTKRDARMWEKRASVMNVLGTVYTVSLSFFVVLSMMFVTLAKQLQEPQYTEAAACSLPATITTTIELTPESSDNIIDCSGQDITVTSTGKLIIKSYTAADSSTSNDVGVVLKVANLTIDAGGEVSADGQGYIPSAVDGGSAVASTGVAAGSGGGHGGAGGAGNTAGGAGNVVGATGNTIGNKDYPLTLGGAGGAAGGGGVGGNGGGAIKIESTGTVTINGLITANGLSGQKSADNQTSGGGGAGGSIWVEAQILAGTGQVKAEGGSTDTSASYYGGGGGGGRIALICTASTTFPSQNVSVAFGIGSQNGQVGTLVGPGCKPSNPQVLKFYEKNATAGRVDREILVGELTTKTALTFASDLAGSNLKLEVEIREKAQSFTNTPTNAQVTALSNKTCTGIPATNNVTISTYCGYVEVTTGLSTSKEYKWQARVVSTSGIPSAWVQFGENSTSDYDFVISGAASSIIILDGNSQSAVVGQLVATKPKAKVVDAAGYGVPFYALTSWSVLTGGGTLSNSVITTDKWGEVTTDWALGPTAGVANNSIKISKTTPALSATFTASALPGAVASYTVDAASNTSLINTPFTYTVTAKDGYGNIVPFVGALSVVPVSSQDINSPGLGSLLPSSIVFDQQQESLPNALYKDGATGSISITTATYSYAESIKLKVFDSLGNQGFSSSIFFVESVGTCPSVVIDRNQTWNAIDAPGGIFDCRGFGQFTVRAGYTLTLQGYNNGDTNYTNDYGVTILMDSLKVENTGVMSANGTGYPSRSGVGSGVHGGYQRTLATLPYGNVYEPVSFGSGTMRSYAGWTSTGHGGGAIKLVVDGNSLIDGVISANGTNATNGESSDGAAGGSVWIDTQGLSGAGSIQTNGGNGESGSFSGSYGGGSGGRIAVYYDSNSGFSLDASHLQSYAGTAGGGYSGAGTVYVENTQTDTSHAGKLIIDNNSHNGLTAGMPEATYSFSKISATRYGHVEFIGQNSILNLSSGSGLEGDNTKPLIKVSGTLNYTGNSLLTIDGVDLGINGKVLGVQDISIGGTNAAGVTLYANTWFYNKTTTHSFNDVTVNGNGILSLVSYQNGTTSITDDYGVTLSLNSLTVASGGFVTADGLGYPDDVGVGSGVHGGYQRNLATLPYGDIYEPVTLGSGTIRNYAGWTSTGHGGGAMKLIVAGSMTVNGTVTSSGKNVTDGHTADGPAGGSVWISAQTLTGSGTIKANGGNGLLNSFGESYGGGSGGRVAVYYGTSSFPEANIQAYAGGNGGTNYSGAGTVYIEQLGVDTPKGGTLIVDNNNHNGQFSGVIEGTYQLKKIQATRYGHVEFIGQNSVLNLVSGQGMVGDNTKPQIKISGTLQYSGSGVLTIDGVDLGVNGKTVGIQDITIGGSNPAGLTLYAKTWFHSNINPYSFGDLTVMSNGTVSMVGYQNGAATYTDDYGVTLLATGINIANGGSITADGLGYPDDVGVGSGVHGGYQRNDGTLPYGNIYQPITLGSGTLRNYAGWTSTGHGGGAIKLVVSGDTVVNGTLTASGKNVTDGHTADGPAGGSIWLDTQTLSGSGTIKANGGNGLLNSFGESYGGGSGGRIAVYYNTNSFPVASIQAYAGGNGGTNYSGAGTIYIEDKSVDVSGKGKLIVDNNMHNGMLSGVPEGSYSFKELQATRYGHVEFIGQNSVLNLVSGAGMMGDTTQSQVKISGTLEYSGVGTLTVDGVDLGINGKTLGIEDIAIGGLNPAGVTLYAKTWYHSNLVPYSFGDVTVESNGTLSLQSFQNGAASYSDDFGVNLGMTSLNVKSGGVVTAEGKGYPDDIGVGSGVHGGYQRNDGTLPYGDVFEPVTLGSGTLRNYAGWTSTGHGGGAIKLVVSGDTIVDGIITANGTNVTNGHTADGPAGGSIWLDTQSLTGTGTISANGGNGLLNSFGESYGGGSGGRIAVYYQSSNFPEANIQAYAGGNGGTYYSGAGTIYLEHKGTDTNKGGKLIVDNNGHNGGFSGVKEGVYNFKEIQATRYGHVDFIGQESRVTLAAGDSIVGDSTKPQVKMSGTLVYTGSETFAVSGYNLGINGKVEGIQNITIGGQNVGEMTLYARTWFHNQTVPFTFGDLLVKSNGLLSLVSYQNGVGQTSDDYGVSLNLSNLEVEVDGKITADGLGYPVNVGAGSGVHAGYQHNLSTVPYGDMYEPTTLGSGIMRSYAGWSNLGAGGGAIKIFVNGTTLLNGSLSANGIDGNGEATDGGAGGSIWLDTGLLQGTGTIKANGGAGKNGYGGGGYGGGTGGRIAVYYENNDGFDLTKTSTQAFGGLGGGGYSGPGTVYLENVTTDAPKQGSLRIDNNGHTGRAQNFAAGTHTFEDVEIGQNVTVWVSSDLDAVLDPLSVAVKHESLTESATVVSYGMNDDLVSAYLDSSGNKKHATGSEYIQSVDGKFGNAQRFLAGDIGMSFESISLPGDWSIDMWVKFPLPATPEGWRTLVHNNGYSNHNIIISSDGQLGAYNSGWYDSSYNVNSLSGWHHLAAVASGSSTKYYIDGTLVGSVPIVMHNSINVIGNGGVNQPAGTLDEIRIQDKAMSSAEILAAATATEPYVADAYTLALWHMDEEVTPVQDASVNGYAVFGIGAPLQSVGRFNYGKTIGQGQLMKTDAVTLGENWTIDMWVKFPLPSTGDGWRTLIANAGGTYHPIIVSSDGTIGTYNNGWASSGYNISALTGWHHVAAVGENTSTKMYIDGLLVGTSASKVTQAISALGNIEVNGARQQAGEIDEVRIRNRAVGPDELLANAQAESLPAVDNSTQLLVHFDNATAKYLADGSGEDLDARSVGTASVIGKYGKGLQFNGLRDYAVVPQFEDDFSQGLTVSLWANPTSNGNYARFMDFNVAGCPNDNILLSRSGTSNDLLFQTFQGTGGAATLVASGAILNNEWHHYTATIDGTGTGRLYRDGELLVSGPMTLPRNVARTTNYIGKSCSGSDALYTGLMDDFSMLNRALSNEEVRAAYNGYTLAEYQASQEQLVGEGVRLVVKGDFTLASGASIVGDGVGFPSDRGIGRGNAGVGYSGGGGGANGGNGGNGQSDGSNQPAQGGSKFGDQLLPVTLGAGGGASGVGAKGGTGGGSFTVIAKGKLSPEGQYQDGNIVVNGTISMNGTAGLTGSPGGGGGAGGSILLHGNTCVIDGTLSATGGEGGNSDIDGGSGGGGRVSVLYNVGPCEVEGTVNISEGTPSDPLNYSAQIGQVGTFPPEPNSVPWPSQYQEQFEVKEEVSYFENGKPLVLAANNTVQDVLNVIENAIPVGGVINGTTVTLKADAFDSGARSISPKNLKIQVELKKVGQAYDGVSGLHDSNTVVFSGGSPVILSVTVQNLEMGASYKWRARTVNIDTGLASDWQEYGGNPSNSADFTITTVASLELTLSPSNMELTESSTLTVVAKNSLGEVDSSYRGTVSFSSTSGTAQLPTSYTFTSGDAGTHVFNDALKFFEAGTFAVTVEDVVNPVLIDTKNITVNIPPVPFVSLSAADDSLSLGESTTLLWQSNYLSNLTIDNGIGAVDTFGNIVVTPPLGQTTYTIQGDRQNGGVLTASVTITVSEQTGEVTPPVTTVIATTTPSNTDTPTPSGYVTPTITRRPRPQTQQVSCPIIEVFTVNNRIIKKGEPVTITWKVSNADKVVIDSFSASTSLSGTSSVVLEKSQTVSLFATKGSCERTATKEVEVVSTYPWEGAGGMLIGLLALETIGMQIGAAQGNLWFALLGFIDRSKKRKPWGVVYDSVKKSLLPRVVVRLWNAETGKLVDTVVTDANGIFKLTPKIGKYVIKVALPNYTFPSKLVTSGTDTGFTNIYFGEVIEVKEETQALMLSIPMDPEKGKMKKQIGKQILSFLEDVVALISPIILIAGFVYSVIVTVMFPITVNYIILALYALTFLIKIYVYITKPRLFGTVTSVEGRVMSGLEIGLFDAEFKNLVARTFTNKQGAYNFVVKNENYFVQLLDNNYKILSRGVGKDGLVIKKTPGNSGVKLVAEDIIVYPVQKLVK